MVASLTFSWAETISIETFAYNAVWTYIINIRYVNFEK